MNKKEEIIRRQIDETLKSLTDRDLKDSEIDRTSREILTNQGLELRKSRKILNIDTGVTEGVENVVNIIMGAMDKDDKIISIEGFSGTGKSSTMAALAEKLKAIKLSMGEIFRYFVYAKDNEPEKSFAEIADRLSYNDKDGYLCLMDGEKNISIGLGKILRAPDIEKRTPDVAKETQGIVIKFLQKELAELKKHFNGKIIIEGRAFTLDFLPSDVRIKLTADPIIRAERRFAQMAG